MPSTEATFAIGTIRAREKGFLTDEQYLRLIEASTMAAAIQVLAETPYGKWFESTATLAQVTQALEKNLKEELDWISDVIDQPALNSFMRARYDALNCAQAIIAFNRGQAELPPLSELGSLPAQLLFSAVWQDLGWEAIPAIWQEILRMKGASTAAILAQAAQTWLAVSEENAVTPLSRQIVALARERQGQDEALRTEIENVESDGATRPTSAVAYEREHDNAVIAALYQYRHEPTGSDPILAYWLGLENEVRTLRLVLIAKAGGVPTEELQELRRNLLTTRL